MYLCFFLVLKLNHITGKTNTFGLLSVLIRYYTEVKQQVLYYAILLCYSYTLIILVWPACNTINAIYDAIAN